jgi:predicted AAA+ superfamily ATPase
VPIDEAHLRNDWAGRLKSEWDRMRRRRRPVHVVATGSSALRIGAGSRESLAGRFERLMLTHWSASSLAEILGVSPRGGVRPGRDGSLPGGIRVPSRIARWSPTSAKRSPAVGRDILALGAVRKPALLRQVFGVCASSPGQIVSLQRIQGQLQDSGALETIAHYLALLEEAFLVAPLAEHSPRPARQRAAPPKLVTLSTGAEEVSEHGENARPAHAWNAGQHVRCWRDEPLEVDGVLEGPGAHGRSR